VLDGVLERVALDLLGQRELGLAVDVDRQQRVRGPQRQQRPGQARGVREQQRRGGRAVRLGVVARPPADLLDRRV